MLHLRSKGLTQITRMSCYAEDACNCGLTLVQYHLTCRPTSALAVHCTCIFYYFCQCSEVQPVLNVVLCSYGVCMYIIIVLHHSVLCGAKL